MQNANLNSPNAEPLPGEQTSESEFLAAQAAAAARAIQDSVARIGADLKDGVDIAAWTRQYPWQAVGIAAACGFLGMAALGSRRSRDELSSALAEALSARNASPASGATAGAGSIFGKLAAELARGVAGSVAGIVEGAIAAAVASRTPQDSQPAADSSTNGHDQAASAV